MRNCISFCVVALTLLFSLNGCGSHDKNQKIVARINRYELTSDDFRDESKLIMDNKNFTGNPDGIKRDLLDEMISKKILLQEAQRMNIDKDAAFMKEIERYWEQALLKMLIRHKMKEISRGITVNLSEVRGEYDRMVKEGLIVDSFDKKAQEIKDDIYKRKVQESLDAWICDLRVKSDIKIYKENL